MGLEIINQAITLDKSLPTFNFGGQVSAFVYGLTAFNFSYTEDHHVQTASVALNATLNGNSVDVTPTVVFKDDSGNTYSPGGSSISVTVIAWVGDGADRNVKFVNWGRSIKNGQASEAIDIGATPVSTNALLSGFDVSYGNDTDHHVERIFANVGTNPSGNKVKLTASVGMYDNSGNNASTATANAGLLAAIADDPGFDIQIVHEGGHTVTFPKPVDEVMAIINGFDVGYTNTDHHVWGIGLHTMVTRSALTPPYSSKYQYTPSPNNAFVAAQPEVHDGSDNHGGGKCNMIVIGRYKK
ncbi:MAG: hypothetical protein AAFY48_10960 [Bacteroidota bacterium]